MQTKNVYISLLGFFHAVPTHITNQVHNIGTDITYIIPGPAATADSPLQITLAHPSSPRAKMQRSLVGRTHRECVAQHTFYNARNAKRIANSCKCGVFGVQIKYISLATMGVCNIYANCKIIHESCNTKSSPSVGLMLMQLDFSHC